MPLSSLLLSLATFGAGFVMRPLGAIMIGHIADSRGRKAGMTLSLALMTARDVADRLPADACVDRAGRDGPDGARATVAGPRGGRRDRAGVGCR